MERLTMAKLMVCAYGMSEKLGHLTFGQQQQQVFLGRDFMEKPNYSQETAVLIDQEVRAIVEGCYSQAKKLLTENIDRLKKLAEKLLEKEVMDSKQVRELLGFPPVEKNNEKVEDIEKEKKTSEVKG